MIEKKQPEKRCVSKKLIKVPYIDQTKEWPTGCESVSAVMLLQYLGIDISVERFVEKYLVKIPLLEKNGKIYGGDPRKVFVGDPADDQSMGCYAPVIQMALENVFREERMYGIVGQEEFERHGMEQLARIKQEKTEYPTFWEALDLTEVPVEALLREYIDNDIPVIFWASIDLEETYEGPEWILVDTGEVFTWRSNEHCMLLVGYDETNYYFNDPWHDHGTIGYERKLVEQRHTEQYQMAVSVRRRSR